MYDIKNIILQKSSPTSSDQPINVVQFDNKNSYAATVKDSKITSQLQKSSLQVEPKPRPSSANNVLVGVNKVMGQFKTTNLDNMNVLNKDNISNERSTDNKGKQVTNSAGWQLVQKKRNNGTIKGSRKVNGTFKGVKATSDLYVGRCDVSVTVDMIKQYVKDELHISVANCICISNSEATVKSFKVTINFEDCAKMLESSSWPENICVRKFYYPRRDGRQTHKQA